MRDKANYFRHRRVTASRVYILCMALCVYSLVGCRSNGEAITIPVFHSGWAGPLPASAADAFTFPMHGERLFMEQPVAGRNCGDGRDVPAPLPNPMPSRSWAPPKWKAQGMSIPSATGGAARFPVVTLDEALGEYFAVMEIGTPSQKAAVAIDTGSQLMWIQCEPCLQCGHQSSHYPVFKPKRSTSYGAVQCDECRGDESVATACTKAEGNRPPLDEPNKCVYFVSYGDKSSSTGLVSTETVSIGGTQQENIVFGCGLVTSGLVSSLNASGLLGLDRGRLSLVTQLGMKAFSYCLPNRVKNVHASGYLTFGALSPAIRSSSELQYTPLLQNQASRFLSQFYYLNVTGISVDGRRLSIPSSAFELLPNGQGGTVIDSGTSITRFVHVAYASLSHAVDKFMDPSLKRIALEDVSPSACYQVPLNEEEFPQAPKVTIHLEDRVDIHLQSHHVLAYMGSDSSSRYYCLAFMDSGNGSNAKNFFGNYQQQDFLVEYDLENSRIGFAPLECNSSKSLRPYYTLIIWLMFLIRFNIGSS
ncbi:hypothetical protein KP509_05G023500 [Ceratopteris richardii]|uniref:Peptidase A1 domain-containing protein n=1 Tax=Ceratopteris richardii TaxID=49495 RepID=A0A8T2URU7_CERRI|nr:hypothetical protein KP509_05G023500 [Ceratopteris richardii]